MTKGWNGTAAIPPKQFIRKLETSATHIDTYRKFTDFLEMAYCTISKKVHVAMGQSEKADKKEERYMKVVDRYRNGHLDTIREVYPKLLGNVIAAVEYYDDYLGIIAAESGILNDYQGQFFTPMPLCLMMARCIIKKDAIEKDMADNGGYYKLYEPASGAGNLILAAAKVTEECGFNVQENMLVWASDLSMMAFQMCYLQLAFSGIPAWVERRNSLSLEFFEGVYTPAALQFYMVNGKLFPDTKTPPKPKERRRPDDDDDSKPQQLTLF